MTAGQQAAIRATVERLGMRLVAKDREIAGEFEANAVLVGSQSGERADGREAIARHFAELMRKPLTVRFSWDRLDIDAEGDLAWIVAEGKALLDENGRQRTVPYRLSGVLRFHDGIWRWRLFHGSEPSD